MRRMLHFLTALACLAGLFSCRVKCDDTSVTICVSRSAGRAYMEALAAGVKDKYGIDVEFVDMFSSARTSQLSYVIAGGEMPADIVLCDTRTPDGYLKRVCLNLLNHSHLSDRFTYGTIKDCTADDGAVYQLPVSSKLIGITYNATLLDEMGWSLPEDFADLLDLKRKCEAAGVPFAVTDLRYTGNGFNYLFNIMGSQWISTIDGSDWLRDFLTGSQTDSALLSRSAYFKKWVENGLFGELVTSKGPAREYAASRALFLFNGRNSSAGAGTDVYKTMPWISEDGSNNSFTRYDNCWVLVSKDLEDPAHKEKLDKVCKILDYISDDEFVSSTEELEPDNYLAFTDFVPVGSQLYSEFASSISSGFVQPWYYEKFPNSVIVATGRQIDSYMIRSRFGDNIPDGLLGQCFYEYDPEASFESVFEEMDAAMRASFVPDSCLCRFLCDFDYPQVARIAAISGAMALQPALPASEEIQVALMPYTPSVKSMHPWLNLGVENVCIHKGPFYENDILILVPDSGRYACAIRMTGARIKEIVASGFDPSGYYADSVTGLSSFDSEHYGAYPYACVTKGGMTLEDDREYLVSVSRNSLSPGVYKSFADQGKVLCAADGDPVAVDISSGLIRFLSQHLEFGPDDINWQL